MNLVSPVLIFFHNSFHSKSVSCFLLVSPHPVSLYQCDASKVTHENVCDWLEILSNCSVRHSSALYRLNESEIARLANQLVDLCKEGEDGKWVEEKLIYSQNYGYRETNCGFYYERIFFNLECEREGEEISYCWSSSVVKKNLISKFKSSVRHHTIGIGWSSVS